MKKISIIGTGYVGLVTGVCFAEVGHEVICADINLDRIVSLNKGIPPFYEPQLEEMLINNIRKGHLKFTNNISEAISNSEIVFVTVGTPSGEHGKMDLNFLFQAIDDIAVNLKKYKVIVIKSTVPAGTTRTIVSNLTHKYLFAKGVDFDIISNPEFLRQGTAVRDCMNPDRVVIGSNDSSIASAIIEDIYSHFTKKIIHTSFECSEMIKNSANAFLAMKISFINNIASICERVGADITKVSEGIGTDQRIGASFLQAGIGYGGSCFPKDTHDLMSIAEQNGYKFELLKSVINTNDNQPILLINKLIDTFGSIEGRQITVLGLSFKPNTSDVRMAPSIKIINELLKRGAIVHVFDPVALDQIRGLFGESIQYYLDLYQSSQDSDACIIATEWHEIVNIEMERLFSEMKYPIIIDGRNCLDYEKLKLMQCLYLCIGRPAIQNYKKDFSNLNIEVSL